MTLVDDTVVERDEQFQVDLVYSEGQPGVLLDTPAKASITVVNDDSECLGVGGRVGGGARWGVEGEGLGRGQVGSGRGRVWEGARWGVEGDWLLSAVMMHLCGPGGLFPGSSRVRAALLLAWSCVTPACPVLLSCSLAGVLGAGGAPCQRVCW